MVAWLKWRARKLHKRCRCVADQANIDLMTPSQMRGDIIDLNIFGMLGIEFFVREVATYDQQHIAMIESMDPGAPA